MQEKKGKAGSKRKRTDDPDNSKGKCGYIFDHDLLSMKMSFFDLQYILLL